MEKAKTFFGTIGAIGAVAFVLHAIVFFTAMHYGAASPGGRQVYRIADHSDTAYIGYGPHVVIRGLAVTMLAGLGVGCVGVLLIEAGERWVKRRRERRAGERKPGGSG